MTAARAVLYLAAGAAGAGVGLTMSAQAPLFRAAPAIALPLGGAAALAVAGGRWALALLVVAPFFPIPFSVSGAVVGPPAIAAILVLLAWVGRMLWSAAACRRLESGSKLPHSTRRGRACSIGQWGISALLLAAIASTCAVALGAGPMTLGGSLKKVAQLAVCFVGPYLFAAEAARDRRALQFAVATFLGFAALEAGYAVLFQFVPGQLGIAGLWPPYLAARAGARAMGTVDASFGHFMAAALVLALAVAAQGEGRLRALGGVAAPILLAGLISSGTRGSAIAAGVGVVALIALSPRRRVVAAALTGLGALVGLAAVVCPQVASPQRIAAIFTGHGMSAFAVRMLSWSMGWELAVAHPWLGVGPGANALAVEGLLGVPAEALRHVEGSMNAYLQAFLETGVIGLAGMIAFILGVSGRALARGAHCRAGLVGARHALPLPGEGTGPRPTGCHARGRACPIALGLGAAVLALGVTGMTGPLLMGGIGHLLFVLAGLAVAAAQDGEA